jgi:hypothetical protein
MALLQWNLFGGGADQARIREAVAARDRARALRVRAASRIDLEVRDARARLDAAREQAGVAKRAIAQAEEALRIVAIRYRGGLATIVEPLNAESALTESRLRLSEAFHDAAVDPIFQGLALSLMAGEVASTLLSRMAVPLLYYMAERRGAAAIGPVRAPVAAASDFDASDVG